MKKHQEVLNRLFKLLDTYHPQEPAFYAHLEEEIKPCYHPDDQILYEEGQVIDKAFFLASGTMTAYTYTDAGDKQLLYIYQAGEIIAGESFTSRSRSAYSLMACADAYTLELTYAQTKTLYEHFPESEAMARKIAMSRESKDIWLKQILLLPGIQMVEEFYKAYPELLEPGKVLRDIDVASFLLLAEGTLRGLRNQLFREGKLKHPKDKNY